MPLKICCEIVMPQLVKVRRPSLMHPPCCTCCVVCGLLRKFAVAAAGPVPFTAQGTTGNGRQKKQTDAALLRRGDRDEHEPQKTWSHGGGLAIGHPVFGSLVSARERCTDKAGSSEAEAVAHASNHTVPDTVLLHGAVHAARRLAVSLSLRGTKYKIFNSPCM